MDNVQVLPKELNEIIFEYAREYSFIEEYNTILNKKYNLREFKICPIIKFFIGKRYKYYRCKLLNSFYIKESNSYCLMSLLKPRCLWKIKHEKLCYDYYELELYFNSLRKKNDRIIKFNAKIT